ncbi:hypothetical protein N9I63_01465 [Hyphomicrobiales bacterium]|nr:hypothetical protein [Hyphomicrobiales bacterium]
MNKLLIALVLAVVMSGNVFADKLYIYCDNDSNMGYEFDRSNPKAYARSYSYSSKTDNIDYTSFSENWSTDNVWWEKIYGISGRFSINRKSLRLTFQMNGSQLISDEGQCSIIDSKDELMKIIKKKLDEKTKGNKF